MFIFKGRTIWSVLAPFAVLGLIFLLTGNTRAGAPAVLQAQAIVEGPQVSATNTLISAVPAYFIASAAASPPVNPQNRLPCRNCIVAQAK